MNQQVVPHLSYRNQVHFCHLFSGFKDNFCSFKIFPPVLLPDESSYQRVHQGEVVFQGSYYNRGHQEVAQFRRLLPPMQSHQTVPFWRRSRRDSNEGVMGVGNHESGDAFIYLSWGVTSLGGFFRYCLKRSSKAWPIVLMTSWANPSEHSRIWHAVKRRAAHNWDRMLNIHKI